MLLIPYAKTEDGVFITPVSCDPGVKPICPCCDETLQTRRGKERVWHFAHLPKSSCGGGGESSQHFAAKLVISGFFSAFNFIRTCSSGEHRSETRFSKKYVSEIEYRIPGTGMTVDVAILTQNGELRGIVEIMHSHKTSKESIESREEYAPCFEVHANVVLEKQDAIELQKVTGDNVAIECINSVKTDECSKACLYKQRQHKKLPCGQCGKWGVGYVPFDCEPTDWVSTDRLSSGTKTTDNACPDCCAECPECGRPSLNIFVQKFERCWHCAEQERRRLRHEQWGKEQEQERLRHEQWEREREQEKKDKKLRQEKLDKKLAQERQRLRKLAFKMKQERYQEREKKRQRVQQLRGEKSPHEIYVEQKRREYFAKRDKAQI